LGIGVVKSGFGGVRCLVNVDILYFSSVPSAVVWPKDKDFSAYKARGDVSGFEGAVYGFDFGFAAGFLGGRSICKCSGVGGAGRWELV
jgi:hypothetical protein